MTNYIYIQNLFREVLKLSKAIEGRFHVAYRYGLQEINYDQLGEVLDEIKEPKKYPLAVMAPPHSYMEFNGKRAGWERFRIILYFVKLQFNNSDNSTANINPKTRTSKHTVPQDWHDMKRVGANFIKVLLNIQRNTFPSIFAVPANSKLFVPVSHVGADRVSGVKLDFDFDLFTGCNEEDYYVDGEPEYPKTITIDLDGHAEHAL